MKKLFRIFLLIIFIISNGFVFSVNELTETNLYYLDNDNNGKIDRLEIEFNNSLTGVFNPDKLFLYSNTGGLSSSKLDSVFGTNIFNSYYLSGNILGINLQEQDNIGTGITVDNTTSSHLRLKTNAGVGIKDLYGNEMRLLYGSSFNDYKNTSFKINQIINQEIIDDATNEETIDSNILPDVNTGRIVENTDKILEEIASVNQNSEALNNIEIISEINTENEITYLTGEINNFSYETKILFQSPSYLLEKDDSESTIFNCDSAKTDCKVNFNLNIDFGSGFENITTDYECTWNFGFSGTTGEENKCNPNTINYPVGEWETIYKIIQKSNQSNYVEKKIKVKNQGYKEEITTKTVYISTVSNTTSPSIINTAISINTPKINIQGGLDENNNCKKADCNANFSYDIKNSKEACLWSFSGGTYDIGTDKKCNPGYIKYKTGDFTVSLRVYEMGNESNYKESFLNFSNKIKEENITKVEETKIETKNEISTQINNVENSINILSPLSGILKISQILANPKGNDDLEWIELENTGNEKINLRGCEFNNKLKSSIKKYKIETDTFLNPSENLKFYKIDTALTLKNTGGVKLDLVCNGAIVDTISWNFDTPEGFIISPEILKSQIISIENQKNKNQFVITFSDGSIIIKEKYDKTSVGDLLKQANANISDKSKIKDFINNSFTQKISKQKKGIKIYGTTISNAKVLIQIKKSNEDNLSFWDFIFKHTYADSLDAYDVMADNDGKYELLIKNPSIGSFEVLSAIKSDKTSNFEIPKTSNFDVDTDYIAYISTDIQEKNTSYNSYLEAVIEVQGVITKDKSLSKNRIVCYADVCSVNFDGRASKGGKDLKYLWDFGNGKSFNKANPASYKFSKGKHIISLKVILDKTENISYFIVEVLGTDQKESKAKSKKLDNIINTVNAKNTDNFEENIINTGLNNNQILYISLLVLLSLILLFILLKKKGRF